MLATTLTPMFNGPLAVPASWTPAGSTHVQAGRGFFDEATELVEGEVLTTSPTLLVPTDLWPHASKNDTVAVAGRTFSVRSRPRLEDDGATKRLVLAAL